MTVLFRIVLFLAYLAAEQACSKPVFGVYNVDEVGGRLFVWDSDSGDWLPIQKGLKIQESQMIQAIGAGRIVVSGHSYRHPLQGFNTLSFEFDRPTILRLEMNSLRTVEFAGLSTSIEGLPDEKAKEEDADDIPFGSAWDILLPVFDTVSREVKGYSERIFGSDEVSVSSKESPDRPSVAPTTLPIEVSSPKDGETFATIDFPLPLGMAWKRPASLKSGKFSIFLWQGSGRKERPLLSTSRTYATIKIRSEGRYYLQITNDDGRYKSKIHAFVVANPFSKSQFDLDKLK